MSGLPVTRYIMLVQGEFRGQVAKLYAQTDSLSLIVEAVPPHLPSLLRVTSSVPFLFILSVLTRESISILVFRTGFVFHLEDVLLK